MCLKYVTPCIVIRTSVDTLVWTHKFDNVNNRGKVIVLLLLLGHSVRYVHPVITYNV